MQCNIDERGRAVRRRGGIICLALGVLALAAALLGAPRWPSLGVGGFLALTGLFQLFESRKGWCAVRAMGFKTPV
jgi:hypothetical protein